MPRFPASLIHATLECAVLFGTVWSFLDALGVFHKRVGRCVFREVLWGPGVGNGGVNATSWHSREECPQTPLDGASGGAGSGWRTQAGTYSHVHAYDYTISGLDFKTRNGQLERFLGGGDEEGRLCVLRRRR